jgi:hypothetical protein
MEKLLRNNQIIYLRRSVIYKLPLTILSNPWHRQTLVSGPVGINRPLDRRKPNTGTGKNYRYLIDGEAFDWLLLAERLCETAAGLVPEKEKFDLLFSNRAPLQLTGEEFKNLIGEAKYHKILKLFLRCYVEEALAKTVAKRYARRGDQIAGPAGTERMMRSSAGYTVNYIRSY